MVAGLDDDVAALVARYADDVRSHADGSPWVVLNMISSLDGAIAVEGRSGGLGAPADRAVFTTLRALADVILVAAGTVRAEGYRQPTVPADVARHRALRGQQQVPTIAVVTRSLRLDLDGPLFTGPGPRPVVVTTTDAPAAGRQHVGTRAQLVEAGTGDVDLAAAIALLARSHGPVVLVEGGPSLNAQLVDADLLDELCLTTAPVIVGGDHGAIVAGARLDRPRRYAIDRVTSVGGLVFARYLRRST